MIAILCRQVEQVSQAAAGDKVCAACEQDVDVDVEIVQDGSYVCPVGDGGVYCAPDEPCSLCIWYLIGDMSPSDTGVWWLGASAGFSDRYTIRR